jgi:hypothetical protein
MLHNQRPVLNWISASRCWAWFGAACAAVAIAACGGSGQSEPAKVTLSADVFPLAVGDRHYWRTTAGAGVGTETSESVSGTLLIDGQTAYALRNESGRIRYLALTSTGLSSLPGPGTAAFDAAFGSIEPYRFGQAVGEVFVPFDRTINVDIDGDGRTDTAQLRYEVTFLGYEDITTNLGTFRGAARLRIGFRGTYLYGGRPEQQTSAGTVEEWHAPGIGKVRSSSRVTFDGGAEQTTVEELVAYRVGALRSESVAPVLLSSVPTAGGVVSGSIAVEMNYSEALDALNLVTALGKWCPPH